MWIGGRMGRRGDRAGSRETEIDGPGEDIVRARARGGDGGNVRYNDVGSFTVWSDISVLVSLLICMSSSLSRPSPLLILVLSALSRRTLSSVSSLPLSSPFLPALVVNPIRRQP